MKTTRRTFGSGLIKMASRNSFASLRREIDLVERLVGDGAPHSVPGVDNHSLGEEAALAVADDHDLRQRGVDTCRVELVYGIPERFPQQRRRIEDGVTSVVAEEPELVTLADPRIIQQIIDHVAPPAGTRGSAVNKDHGNAPRPVDDRGELR